MFDEFMGLPAHPLLVHAAVVLVPLQVVAALGYALVPLVRKHAAWAVLGLAVAAPGAALLAKLSGDAFRAKQVKDGASGAFLATIDQHRDFGTYALYGSAVLGVLMILLWFVRRAAEGGTGPIVIVVSVLVVVASAITAYYIFKTGDSGARMVWG